MNSIQSELARLGITQPKRPNRVTKKGRDAKKPKLKHHCCKQLVAQQEVEAQNFQYGYPEEADTTAVIYASKDCASARVVVPYYHCDSGQWNTIIIPINHCPFCGEKLNE